LLTKAEGGAQFPCTASHCILSNNMRAFAELFANLDQTNKTNSKVALLKAYFQEAADADRLWVLAFFSHKRPKRQINMQKVKAWAAEQAQIPEWLFAESYNLVGDLAETIALLLPKPTQAHDQSLSEWVQFIKKLGGLPEEEQKAQVLHAWDCLNEKERFIFIKLLTGGFRVGISQNLVVRALAEAFGQDKAVVAHRVMGNWQPENTDFHTLVLEESPNEDLSKPYPFCLAHQLEGGPEALGMPEAWAAEWKWDGIRGQAIVRKDTLSVWSRGEELVTDKFPEFKDFAEILPNGTALDGEILCFAHGQPLPFGELQTRIGRKNVTKSVLKKAPVAFMAYDLLEHEGKDQRKQPYAHRRQLLESLFEQIGQHDRLVCSPLVKFSDWDALTEARKRSREHAAEGLMLKRKDSPYHVGRKRGDWWKWKVDPLTIDGVLLYAQKGHGRRAGLFTDYTFGVWNEGELVVFTKAYSGLTDKEFREVDAFIKKNTREKFGPVRTVTPELVFELAFEGIRASSRHKSGVALRFPRISRWRRDKKPQDADTLQHLHELLSLFG